MLPSGASASVVLAETQALLERRADSWCSKGSRELAGGRTLGATEAFERALDFVPDHACAREGLREIEEEKSRVASEHMTRARVYERAHKIEPALVEYGRALEIAGEDSRQGRLALARIAALTR